VTLLPAPNVLVKEHTCIEPTNLPHKLYLASCNLIGASFYPLMTDSGGLCLTLALSPVLAEDRDIVS
jgi:hypothetical protein